MSERTFPKPISKDRYEQLGQFQYIKINTTYLINLAHSMCSETGWHIISETPKSIDVSDEIVNMLNNLDGSEHHYFAISTNKNCNLRDALPAIYNRVLCVMKRKEWDRLVEANKTEAMCKQERRDESRKEMMSKFNGR